MKRLSAVIILSIFLFVLASPAGSTEKACFKSIGEDDLVCRPEFCPGIFPLGNGLNLQLNPGTSPRKLMGPPVTWMNITVLDGNNPVHHLPDSFYLGYGYLQQGDFEYIMIGEYTGGMHCCSRYHFYVRSASGGRLRYLGKTAETAEGLDEDPFSCQNDQLYLEDWDARFLYFHTPYAKSLLLFPTHYKITPSLLAIDNIPFREKYLSLIDEIDADIQDAAAKRERPAASLLLEKDGSDFFSDEIGQLIIKRTILYIYAREERQAWESLERDLKKYYQNDSDMHRIRNEIKALLAEGPY
jgi:hypothetical protein